MKFDGQKDKDWAVREYKYRLAGGIVNITYVFIILPFICLLKAQVTSYKLYAFKSGTFSLLGDGGYANVRRDALVLVDESTDHMLPLSGPIMVTSLAKTPTPSDPDTLSSASLELDRFPLSRSVPAVSMRSPRCIR